MPLKHDSSHRIAIKSAIEQVLGREAWYGLKECTSISPWRTNVLKVLRAIRISIEASVHVKDQAWIQAIDENLKFGEAGVKSSKDIDELLSSFEATLLRQVFLQIGAVPNQKGRPGVTLSKKNWRLNSYRSVQYVQTQSQLEALFWNEQQTRIGFDKQMELEGEYRWSKSPLSYSEWCKQQHVEERLDGRA